MKDTKFPSFLDSYYWIPQDDSLFTGLLYCGILFGTYIFPTSTSYLLKFVKLTTVTPVPTTTYINTNKNGMEQE